MRYEKLHPQLAHLDNHFKLVKKWLALLTIVVKYTRTFYVSITKLDCTIDCTKLDVLSIRMIFGTHNFRVQQYLLSVIKPKHVLTKLVIKFEFD